MNDNLDYDYSNEQDRAVAGLTNIWSPRENEIAQIQDQLFARQQMFYRQQEIMRQQLFARQQQQYYQMYY